MTYEKTIKIGGAEWRWYQRLLAIENIRSLSDEEAEKLGVGEDDEKFVCEDIEFSNGKQLTIYLYSDSVVDPVHYNIIRYIYDEEEDDSFELDCFYPALGKKMRFEHEEDTYIINFEVVSGSDVEPEESDGEVYEAIYKMPRAFFNQINEKLGIPDLDQLFESELEKYDACKEEIMQFGLVDFLNGAYISLYLSSNAHNYWFEMILNDPETNETYESGEDFTLDEVVEFYHNNDVYRIKFDLED